MKRLLVVGAPIVGLTVIVSLLLVPAGRAQSLSAGQAGSQEFWPRWPGDDERRIRLGLLMAPVPLNLVWKNVALVGLGSYFVNSVGDCNGCHTKNFEPYLQGGNPYLGEPEKINPDHYLVGGSEFGPFISRNLRPHRETGLPAGRTFEQFLHIIRTGADLAHLPPAELLQVMPWPSFAKMTDRDIRAIYEYLSALPPHEGYPE